MKKCLFYSRVSTEMQVEGYSLDAQIVALERYAKNHGIEVCERYQDAGKSGKNIEGRPEFQRMLNDIKTGKHDVDYVLVCKLSRFARSSFDALKTLRELRKYDMDLICTEEGLDTSSAFGKLIFIIMSSICEMERENIKTQTMEGRREKARQGKWNGGTAPYGYSIGGDDVLVVNEEERPVIELIYHKFSETDWGFNKIAKYLNNSGIQKNIHISDRELSLWSASMIKNIIDNEVYYGKMPYGKRTLKTIQGEDKRVWTDDYILEDGQHEGIISEETWLTAKRRRIQTQGKREKTIGLGREHLLTGILKCPECGSPMYATRRGTTDKDMLYYYKCGRQTKVTGHVCSYTKQLRQEEINAQVFQAIVNMIDCGQFAEEVDAKLQKEVDTERIDQDIQNVKKELSNTKANKNSLEVELDSLSADTPHYHRKRQDMQKRLDALYDKLDEQESLLESLLLRKRNVEEDRIQKETIYDCLKNFSLLYDKFTDEERKRFYNLFIEKIELYKEPLENGQRIKSIDFKFPITVAGDNIGNILWEENDIIGQTETGDMIKLKTPVPEIKIVPIRPATYGQIKAFVKERHGVSVHSCYIAEVKTKCGLDMRENFNVSKKNAPKKHCTKEKEGYILEALKHFHMIQ